LLGTGLQKSLNVPLFPRLNGLLSPQMKLLPLSDFIRVGPLIDPRVTSHWLG
jgi:hypothetical protein